MLADKGALLKILPPFTNPKTIVRKRLDSFMADVRCYRAVFISAPAGYGKSTLMSQSYGKTSHEAPFWLSLDNTHKDPACFLLDLIKSFRNHYPGFGEKIITAINSIDGFQKHLNVVISSVIEDFSALPEDELFLYLDDFHVLDDMEVIHEILYRLITQFNIRLHLVIASRRSMPESFTIAMLKGYVSNWDAERLKFMEDEIIDLFREHYSSRLSLESASRIASATEGWVLAVQLLAQADIRWNAVGQSRQKVGTHQELYVYFANEVFNGLPENLANYLIKTSPFPYIAPNISRLLYESGEIANPDVDIRQLPFVFRLADDKLLHSINENNNFYLYHHLFQDYLMDRLKKSMSEEGYKAYLVFSAGILGSMNEWESAYGLYIAAGDFNGALELIAARGIVFLEQGKLESVMNWISLLPENIAAEDGWVLFYRGTFLMHTQPDAAKVLFYTGESLFRKKGNIDGVIRCILGQNHINAVRNDIAAVKKAGSRMPILGALKTSRWTRGVLLVSALGKAIFDDSIQNAAFIERLIRPDWLDDYWKTYYSYFKSLVRYRQGNLKDALKVMEETFCLPFVGNNEKWLATGLAMYCMYVSNTSDIDKGKKTGHRLLELGEKYNNSFYRAYGHMTLYKAFLRTGDFENAKDRLEECRHYFLEASNLPMYYNAEIEWVKLCLMTDRKSSIPVETAVQAYENQLKLHSGQGIEDYTCGFMGIIYWLKKDYENAEKHLLKSLKASLSKKAMHFIAGTCFNLAGLYYETGREKESREYLKQAADLSVKYGYMCFWDWYGDNIKKMCTYALKIGVNVAYALEMLQLWFPADIGQIISDEACKEDNPAKIKWLLPLMEHTTDEGAVLILRLLNQLYDTACKETRLHTSDLVIKTFGILQIFKDDCNIPEEQWKTKKSKSILKLLLLRERIHKEELADMLWPETDMQKALNNLKVCVNNIKKAISSDLIIYLEDFIILNPIIHFDRDDRLFEEYIRNAKAFSASENRIHALAYAIEADNIYKGEWMEEETYNDAFMFRREKYRNMASENLLWIVSMLRETGMEEKALIYCYKLIELDRYCEEGYRTAMEILGQKRKNLEAIRLYKTYIKYVNEELGLKPGREITSLYRDLCG